MARDDDIGVVIPSRELAEEPPRLTSPIFDQAPLAEHAYPTFFSVPGGLLLTACFFLFWIRAFEPSIFASYNSPLLVPLALFGLGVSVITIIRRKMGGQGRQAFDWLLSLLWCGAAFAVAMALRSSLLQDVVIDVTRMPFVIAWLALTYLGSLALLPSFPRDRRPGRLIWTGASLSVLLIGLLTLETVAPTFDVRLATTASILLCGPPIVLAATFAFAPRPQESTRPARGRLLWSSLFFGTLASLALVFEPLASIAGLWLAILAAAALFIGGATAEWEAVDA